MMSIDYRTGVMSIVDQNGLIHSVRDNLVLNSGPVLRSTFLTVENRVEFLTLHGQFSIVLGPSQQHVNVPVVYLDQNHWIDFARWRKNPNQLDTARAEFFELLDSLIMSERIVLPISGAHIIEMSRRDGPNRLDLASTMLHYCRGWQLRSVLALRRAELRCIFGGIPLTNEEVITLDPESVFDMASNHAFDGYPDWEIAGLLRRQVWAATLVSLMLDEEPTERAEVNLAAKWAQSFGSLANERRNNPKAKARSREATKVRFIIDLGTDLAGAAKESGASPDDFLRWMQQKAEADFSLLPGVARLREVLHLRISNADEKWEANDLNDWMYLCYAGAYCDLVLGERKTITYLRRVERAVPPGAILHRRAADATADLKSLLVRE